MSTLLSTATAVCLALLCIGTVRAETCSIPPSCTVDGVLYTANLYKGESTNYLTLPNQVLPELEGFSVEEVEPLSQKSNSGSICDWEGLLNITIPTAVDGVQNRSLKFEFVHDTAPNALGFPSFHIGDSDSNNAYGAGCTTTSHCAQIFNQGDTLKIRSNAEPGHPTPPLFASESNFITQKVDIVVGDKFIVAENLNELKREYCSNFLFSLNGAPPSVGVADYSVHLGMNRLIEESFMRHRIPGAGLCHVEILALTCTSVEFESVTEGATVATSIMP